MCVSSKSVEAVTGLFGISKVLGLGDKPTPVAPPQMPKAPENTPLKRRPLGGPLPAPAGGTLLTGSSGIADAALLLGGTGLLGGGKG